MRAVGKTYLLHRALERRLPIFGPPFDAQFHTLSAPGLAHEWKLPPAEAWRRNTWIASSHFHTLSSAPSLPALVVAHLDLLHWCDAKRRGIDRLADARANLACMLAHPGTTFLARFERVAISTLHAPWELTARRFHRRLRSDDRGVAAIDRRLYDQSLPAPAAYDAVVRAWLACVWRLRPTSAHLLRWDDLGRELHMHSLPLAQDGDRARSVPRGALGDA